MMIDDEGWRIFAQPQETSIDMEIEQVVHVD
jgi:hypothetical protein